MSQPGTYILVLRMKRETQISIGQLGTLAFPGGYYLYAGSARGPGGLQARLARHFREGKRLRWHVDYLLPKAQLAEIWKAYSTDNLECLWAGALLRMPGARTLISGFGSSDCGCPSHLIYFPSLPSFQTFTSKLHALGAKPRPEREVPGEPGRG